MAAMLRIAMVALCLALPLTAAQAQALSALPDAVPIGTGTYRWFGLKLYDATLWAARGSFRADTWSSAPLAIELAYARSLKGEKIAEASVDEMKKLGVGSPAQLRAWGEAMKRVFPDVDENTRLTGVYQPGQPTHFFRNGAPSGEIADPAFGPAFFAIWLHPNTSAPKLRAALLGK